MRLYKDDLSMIPFFNRIINKFMQVAREANVDLSIDFPEDIELISNVDEDRMEQVFTNLIDNAIRHTPDGGSVRLSILKYVDMIEINVTDTGVGIPEEDLPYIFERFYKADKARTRGKGGTGLGLAIAKSIVDSHGGRITAKKGDIEGTIFSCTLPLKNYVTK